MGTSQQVCVIHGQAEAACLLRHLLQRLGGDAQDDLLVGGRPTGDARQQRIQLQRRASTIERGKIISYGTDASEIAGLLRKTNA